MSVIPTDVRFYGSANMPDADGLTTGGAVSFAKKVMFSDITPNGLMNYVSSSASDTAVVLTQTGRDAQGRKKSEGFTLTGTTPVLGAQTFERLLKMLASGTTAVGDVASISNTKVLSARTCQTGSANASGITPALVKLQAGDGASVTAGMILRFTNNTPSGVQYALREVMDSGTYGTDVVVINRDLAAVPTNATTYDVHQGMLLELSPNQITECRRAFYDVAADVVGGSTRTFYEKVFVVNNNTTIALTNAIISKQADPNAGTLQFALTNALNDTGTVANRQTAPASGITAFTSGSSPQSINVPSPQDLSGGTAPNTANAEGVWVSWALTAGLAPGKTSTTLRGDGVTV